MKEYELTVLIHPDLESQLDTTLDELKSLIASAGGTVTKEDNWGKKRLAYSIKRENFAIYVSLDLELPADAPLKISNTLNITEYALRYLLVTVDDKERKKLEESKKRSARADEEE